MSQEYEVFNLFVSGREIIRLVPAAGPLGIYTSLTLVHLPFSSSLLQLSCAFISFPSLLVPADSCLRHHPIWLVNPNFLPSYSTPSSYLLP